ncbi:hypothetical protein R1sor_016169 [Riccia sorocarpa]|uniref:Uncharacterized protein n=1 Tax=Riccia sorocarpa TaxID=122646 RepID=A0ABD3HHQ7_9MARC
MPRWKPCFGPLHSVLDSSTVAAVVGQSVKRFTSAAFGKGFNLKLIIWWNAVYPFCGYRILALSYGGRDRRGNRNGFGKGLLGFFIRFTVIVAALFMYDGQASQTTAIYDDLALIGKPSPTVDNGENQLDGVAAARTQEFYRAAEKLPSVKEGQVTLQELGDESGSRHIPLRESVGHTKLEVLVGAIWGIVTALALHSSFEL